MPTYFYNDGEREVRIEADSYEQVSSSGGTFIGGQCPVDYSVRYNRVTLFSSGGTQTTSHGNTVRGPIQGIRVEQVSARDSRIWIDHNNTTRRVASESFSDRQYLSAEITEVVRSDGQPDNCGNLPSGCETQFTRNGAVFFTLNDCPPIREGDDCANCCAELLPIARSIRI